MHYLKGKELPSLERYLRKGEEEEEVPLAAPVEEAPPVEGAAPPEGKLTGVADVDDREPIASEEELLPSPKEEFAKMFEEPRVGTVISPPPDSPLLAGKIIATKEYVEITPTLTDYLVVGFVDRAKKLLEEAIKTYTENVSRLSEKAKQKIIEAITDDLSASMQFLYQMTKYHVISDAPIIRLTMEHRDIVGIHTTRNGRRVIEISIPKYVEEFAPIFSSSPDTLAKYIATGSYPLLLHEIVHTLVEELADGNPGFTSALMDWYQGVKGWATVFANKNPLANGYFNVIKEYMSDKEYTDFKIAKELFTRVATLELAAVYPHGFELDRIDTLNVVPFLTATAVLGTVRRLDSGGYFAAAEKLYEKYFANMLVPPRPKTTFDKFGEIGPFDIEKEAQLEAKWYFESEYEDERFAELVDWAKFISAKGFKVDRVDEVIGDKDAKLIFEFLRGTKSIEENKEEFSLLMMRLNEKIRKLHDEIWSWMSVLGPAHLIGKVPTWEEFLRSRWEAEKEAFTKEVLKWGLKSKKVEEAYALWLEQNESRLRQQWMAELDKFFTSQIIIPAGIEERVVDAVRKEIQEKTDKVNLIKRIIENLEEKRLTEIGVRSRKLADVIAEVEGELFIPAGITAMGMQDAFGPITTTVTREISPGWIEVYVAYQPAYKRFIKAIDLLEERRAAEQERKFPESKKWLPVNLEAVTETVPYRPLTDKDRANFSLYSHQFPIIMTYMTEVIDPSFLNPENREKTAKYLTSSLRVILEEPSAENRIFKDIAVARLFEFAKAIFVRNPKPPSGKAEDYIAALRKSILQTSRWNVEHYDTHPKILNFISFLVEHADILVNPHQYLGGDRDIFDAIHILLTYYQNYLIKPSDLGPPIRFVHAFERGISAFRQAIAKRKEDPDLKNAFDIPASDTDLRKRLETWKKEVMEPFIDSSTHTSEYRVAFADGRKAFQYIASQVPLKTLKDIHESLKKLLYIYKKWTAAPLDEQIKSTSTLDEMAHNISQIETLRKQKAPQEDIEALTLDTVLAAFQFLLENPMFIKASWGQWGDEAVKALEYVIHQLNPFMHAFLLGFYYPREAISETKYVHNPFDFRAIMLARYMERVKRLALGMNKMLSESPTEYFPARYWTDEDIKTIAHGVADENMQVVVLDVLTGGRKKKRAVVKGEYLPAAKGTKRNPGIYYYYLHNYPRQFAEALRDWVEQHPDRKLEPILVGTGNPHPDFLLAPLFSGYKLPQDKIREMALTATEAWQKFRSLWDRVHARYVREHYDALMDLEQGYTTPNRYSDNPKDVGLSLAYYRRKFLSYIMGEDVEKPYELSDFVGFLEYFHYTRGSYVARVSRKSKFPDVMSLRGSSALTIREFFELFEKALTDEEKKELYDLYQHPGFSPFVFTTELMLTHARQNVEDSVVANALRRIDDEVEPPLSFEELEERLYRMEEAETYEDAEISDVIDNIEEAIVSPEAIDHPADAAKVNVEGLEAVSDELAKIFRL